MLKKATEKLLQQKSLSSIELKDAFEAVTSGENPIQAAAFLTLLKAKDETAEEITLLVEILREKMQSISLPYPTLDIVGTGGDGLKTLNISTASALLAASCGVKIAKHGNRSVSSLCGSADVLEALGFPLSLETSTHINNLDKYNFTFLYAPEFHPVFANLRTLRKELGFPTIFNLVGPLLNPANSSYLMMGVAKDSYLSLFKEVLVNLSFKKALLFHGNGLDEITLLGSTKIIEINDGVIHEYTFNPTDYGFSFCELEEIQGRDAVYNAQAILKIFKGEQNAFSDTVILNAGFALYLYGISSSLEKAFCFARESLESGKAHEHLQQMLISRAKGAYIFG